MANNYYLKVVVVVHRYNTNVEIDIVKEVGIYYFDNGRPTYGSVIVTRQEKVILVRTKEEVLTNEEVDFENEVVNVRFDDEN